MAKMDLKSASGLATSRVIGCFHILNNEFPHTKRLTPKEIVYMGIMTTLYFKRKYVSLFFFFFKPRKGFFGVYLELETT